MPDYQHKLHYTVCNVNQSLAGGGANDVQKHSETPDHKKLADALQSNNFAYTVYFVIPLYFILFCLKKSFS